MRWSGSIFQKHRDVHRDCFLQPSSPTDLLLWDPLLHSTGPHKAHVWCQVVLQSEDRRFDSRLLTKLLSSVYEWVSDMQGGRALSGHQTNNRNTSTFSIFTSQTPEIQRRGFHCALKHDGLPFWCPRTDKLIGASYNCVGTTQFSFKSLLGVTVYTERTSVCVRVCHSVCVIFYVYP